MKGSLVIVETIEPGIVRIALNDPESRNAMSEEMGAQFAAEIKSLREKETARVAIITGSGQAFSGGGHLDMLFEKTKASRSKNRAAMERFYAMFLSVMDLEIPTIAALNGHAIGAGMCLALACDLRIAAAEAKLGLNFVQLGLHPGMGATYFLPRLLGPARAAELLLAGKIVTATHAAEIGLVNRTVPGSELEGTARELAQAVAACGPESVRALKRTLRTSAEVSLADALRREAECQADSYQSAEFKEGITAAREKRKPRFAD